MSENSPGFNYFRIANGQGSTRGEKLDSPSDEVFGTESTPDQLCPDTSCTGVWYSGGQLDSPVMRSSVQKALQESKAVTPYQVPSSFHCVSVPSCKFMVHFFKGFALAIQKLSLKLSKEDQLSCMCAVTNSMSSRNWKLDYCFRTPSTVQLHSYDILINFMGGDYFTYHKMKQYFALACTR